MKDHRIYLEHILESLSAVTQYVKDGESVFFNDRKTQKAVLRELQELAESTQRLSTGLKKQRPEIPWRDISGFRDVLVHDYLGLNLAHIWSIVENDLQPLRDAVNALLRDLPPGK